MAANGPETHHDFSKTHLQILGRLAAIYDPDTFRPPEAAAAHTIISILRANDIALRDTVRAGHPDFTHVLDFHASQAAVFQTSAQISYVIGHENAACVPILFGAVPMVQRIAALRLGFRQNPIFPIVIQRSHGMNLDGSRAIGQLNYEGLKHASVIVVLEDLFDHGGAAVKAAHVVQTVLTDDPEKYRDTQILRQLDQVPAANFEQGRPLYDAFARRLVAGSSWQLRFQKTNRLWIVFWLLPRATHCATRCNDSF